MDIQAILHSRKMSSLLKKMQKGVDVSSFTVPISRCSIVNEIIDISQARKNLSQEQYNSVYALYKIYDNEKTEIPMTPYEYIILYGKMIDEFQQLAPWQMYNGDGRPYVSSELLQRIQKTFPEQSNSKIRFLPYSACESKSIDISHVDLFLSASTLKTYYMTLKRLEVCDFEYVKSYVVPKYDDTEIDFSCCRESDCLFVNSFPAILSTENIVQCTKIHLASLLLSPANPLVDQKKILDIASYRALIVPTTDALLEHSESEIRSNALAKYQAIFAELNDFSFDLALFITELNKNLERQSISYDHALYKYYSYIADQCSIKNKQHFVGTCICNLGEWRDAALKNNLPKEMSSMRETIISVTGDSNQKPFSF